MAKGSQTSDKALEDIKSLEEFCQKVHYDRVDLPDWKSLHSELNLTIPLFIKKSELQSQGSQNPLKKQINYSRIIRGEIGSDRREPSCVQLTIPSLVAHLQVFIFKKLGDARGEDQGDLIIRIELFD